MATDFELQVLTQLGDIQAQLATTAQAVQDLTGPTGRVTKLEKDAEWHDRKQWIHTAVLVPLATVVHIAARKMGIDV